MARVVLRSTISALALYRGRGYVSDPAIKAGPPELGVGFPLQWWLAGDLKAGGGHGEWRHRGVLKTLSLFSNPPTLARRAQAGVGDKRDGFCDTRMAATVDVPRRSRKTTRRRLRHAENRNPPPNQQHRPQMLRLVYR